MRIRIIAVGTKMPDWVEQGYAEYAKRMPRDVTVEMLELPLAQRGKNTDIATAMAKEGEAMLAAWFQAVVPRTAGFNSKTNSDNRPSSATRPATMIR